MPRWASLAMIAAFAFVGTGLVLQNGISQALGLVGPKQVLAINPWDARANAAQAEAYFVPDVTRDAATAAAGYAQRALRRDATVVEAARAMGFAMEMNGNKAGARRAVSFAERVSRRDLSTQLWLLEDNVSRGNVVGALQHFDVALRSSKTAGPILVPVLVNAIEQRELTAPIVKLLATRPAWAEGYLITLVQTGKSNARIVELFHALAAADVPVARYVTDTVVRRLVDAGDYGLAWQAYSDFYPQHRGALLRNGDFERADASVAFDWQAIETPGVGAEPVGVDGGTALALRSDIDSSGPAIRQLLILKQGRYLLSGSVIQTGSAQRERPFFAISCASSPSEIIGKVEITPQGEFRGPFEVADEQCDAQWIVLNLPTAESSDVNLGTIDNLSITAE